MQDKDQLAAGQCDDALAIAIDTMRRADVPLHIVVDRLATHGAFIAVQAFGKEHTASQFKRTAEMIEAGLFDGLGIHRAGRG